MKWKNFGMMLLTGFLVALIGTPLGLDPQVGFISGIIVQGFVIADVL